jgi:hypothetical protein
MITMIKASTTTKNRPMREGGGVVMKKIPKVIVQTMIKANTTTTNRPMREGGGVVMKKIPTVRMIRGMARNRHDQCMEETRTETILVTPVMTIVDVTGNPNNRLNEGVLNGTAGMTRTRKKATD